MFGGGGLNPRKMKQMMKQMGIEVEDIDAEEVIIRTKDEDLVFTNADVQQMDAQGQKTYQIVGEPESRPRGEGGSTPAVEGEVVAEEDASTEVDIPDSDVEIVAQRTGASATEAREALKAENGDLAAAISRLE
ncbi:nascent polypeptide-associated complex protein [Haladaptatus sp. DJG-WS-42]|uniref:nascent polypeptide-associated complex protein n=1 Tax=Haladaptatus sp. DJG-WS-42 TaxID=3120516 RepID=UPI0030CA8974